MEEKKEQIYNKESAGLRRCWRGKAAWLRACKAKCFPEQEGPGV